jgi:hypothetical protein
MHIHIRTLINEKNNNNTCTPQTLIDQKKENTYTPKTLNLEEEEEEEEEEKNTALKE